MKTHKNWIRLANADSEEYHNRKREEPPKWKAGNKVWLNMENIRTRRPTKKLDHKWTGPYAIIESVGTHAYRLDLPGDLQRIHNVFHVDRLKSHFSDPFERTISPPPPVYIKGEPEYEVKSILDSRHHGQKLYYLVKWTGYDKNSWEPASEIKKNAGNIINEFHQAHPTASSLSLS